MKKYISLLVAVIVLLLNCKIVSGASTSDKIYDSIIYNDTDQSKTINVGDEIEIGTEKFYIISNKDNTIRALSMYNLNVGFDSVNYIKTAKINPTGIQNAEDKGSSASKNFGTGNGVVPYSTENVDYDSSSIKIYVDTYVEFLKSNYNVEVSGDLITAAELKALGCNYSYGNTCTTSPYKWLYSTSYWIKNDLRYSKKANYVTYDGFFNGFDYDMLYADSYFGVRPVICFDTKYINKYTVTFKDYDGTILKKQENVEYNTRATAPNNPTRDSHTFIGWDKSFDNVTEDLVVTAQYDIAKYTIKFINEDGKELSSKEYEYGTNTSNITRPSNPKKSATAQYIYTFNGWSPEITSVTQNQTYIATYTKHINKYIVTFKDYDGTILKKQENVEYNTRATAPNSPTRDGYTFIGWDKSFDNVTEDLVITALYEDTYCEVKKKKYTVDASVNNGNSISFTALEGDTYNFSIIERLATTDEELQQIADLMDDPEYTFESLKTKLNKLIGYGKNAAGVNETLLKLYEIYLYNNGIEIHKVDDGFKLKLKMTDDMKGYDLYKLVYIADDGTTEKAIELTKNGEYLEGTLLHLSMYALVGKKNETTTTNTNTTVEETIITIETETTTSNNPKTGDNITIWISLMIISIIGIVGTIKLSKKNK